jgi:O-methyltransferase domain/Dimerisation domain
MKPDLWSADDGPLWDLHLSGFIFPSMTAADEAGVFDHLAAAPGTAEDVAQRLGLNRRATRSILPLLASAGLLLQRLGRYYVSETARIFLLRESPFYWGPVLGLIREIPMTHANVAAALRAPETVAIWDAAGPDNPTSGWSEGSIAPDLAKAIAAYMDANCLCASLVAAQRVDVSESRSLLDVGGGSGCFSIALAKANPRLRCTIMDLQSMCDVAMGYVREAGVHNRVDVCPVDMFRQEWPRGHDTILFSNIFHDWDFGTCTALARKAYDALPGGGRILLHEMLLDDTHDGPPTAAAFSVYMLLATKGQQFTAAELARLLTEVGFVRLTLTPCHGYFSVIAAVKP